MPKLPRIDAKKIIKFLEKKGFECVRQSGSHMIFKNLNGIRVTLPNHGSKILHPKIIKQIIMDLNIDPKELK